MSIGIRDLKNSLSKQLAAVRRGQTIAVTDHGQPIARIVPIAGASAYDRLVEQGRITRAVAPRRSSPVPVIKNVEPSDLIDEQRR